MVLEQGECVSLSRGECVKLQLYVQRERYVNKEDDAVVVREGCPKLARACSRGKNEGS
jgi:hypothetical protein